MRDPSLAIQKAIFKQISTFAPLIQKVSNRVYDDVPEGASTPFIRVGDDEFEPEYFYTIVSSTVHGVTAGVGVVEAKALGAIIKSAMSQALILEDGFEATLQRYESTDVNEVKEDGLQIVSVTFSYYVQDLL